MPELFAFAAMPQLETERLVLRAVRPEDDLPALYELFADPHVARYTDTGPFQSLADAAEVMDWIGQLFAGRRGMRWAVALETDERKLIGTCGFNEWARKNRCAVIGYDLVQRLWGQGLMTEALTAMIAFGFERMALNRIEADVTVGNDASARVLEKLGFREEGVLRQRGHWKGAFHDLRFFSLLRQEWRPASPGK